MSFLGSERLYMRMVSMLYAYVVRLSGMSGCPVLSGTDLPSARPPNDPRQVRRGQAWRSARLTAQDAHGKRHG